MTKNENVPAIVSLWASIVIVLAIALWPIYFFGFSTIKIIEMDASSLITFSIVELALILAIIIQWFAHKRVFK